jgi:hypothetical protein
MLDTAKAEIAPWTLKGELILNCNCTVFCPCVVSLGAHPPTEGSCKAWLGVRIDEGKWGKTDLSGLNVAMMLDIPGMMGEGDWKAAGYFDDRADNAQFTALERIFTGNAKGTTGLFRLLVSTYYGSSREEVSFTTEGNVRHLTVGRYGRTGRGRRSGQGTGGDQHQILDGRRHHRRPGAEGQGA